MQRAAASIMQSYPALVQLYGASDTSALRGRSSVRIGSNPMATMIETHHRFSVIFVAHQAAWLARRLRAEIILLHVVTPLSYPAGLLESGHEITEICTHTSSSGLRKIWIRPSIQNSMASRDPRTAQGRSGPRNREGGT